MEHTMPHIVKIIAQLVDEQTGKVIEQQVVQQKHVSLPPTFDDFGLRHKQQVELIKNSQDFLLKFECKLLSTDITCPHCGSKPRKQGMIDSDFHDVYTDHKISIQRLSCTCGWRNHYTLNSIYGSSIHPELAQLQAKHASNMSFEKACQLINDFSGGDRKINNRATLSRITHKVGDCLDIYKKSEEWSSESSVIATELIMVTDGGHVQDRDINKHSFEEMVSTVFNAEDLIVQKDDSHELKKRISVASARKDAQYSIKRLTRNACLRSGMNKQTKITALTDGANNCWSIVNSLSSYCGQITRILDWFHIGKKFKERESKIPNELRALYNKGKWHLWHGRPRTAIIRLNQLQDKLTDKEVIKKVNELKSYITNNEGYIVNYHIRKIKKLSYSSQLAETSVNCIINERQKNKKMQWSRSGAHDILQIRTSLFSKTWQQDWDKVKEKLYTKAA